ncbi:MAG: hypothetical protein JSV12_07990 [Candidatus Bathyarchaeota archaeon]|nr:MAG: hypothetical protein JSV12_07990 [Candidatus Bathyarchaeota archaeon]
MPSRTNKALYEILMQYDPMSERNQKFWKAHFSIKGVVFKNDQIIVSYRNPSSAKVLIDHLKKDLVPINEVLLRHGFPEFSISGKKVK